MVRIFEFAGDSSEYNIYQTPVIPYVTYQEIYMDAYEADLCFRGIAIRRANTRMVISNAMQGTLK